jgi:hypothetical protein
MTNSDDLDLTPRQVIVPVGTRVKPEGREGPAFKTTVQVLAEAKLAPVKVQTNQHKLGFCHNPTCMREQQTANNGKLIGMRAAIGAFAQWPMWTCTACGTQITWATEGEGVRMKLTLLDPDATGIVEATADVDGMTAEDANPL